MLFAFIITVSTCASTDSGLGTLRFVTVNSVSCNVEYALTLTRTRMVVLRFRSMALGHHENMPT